MNSIYGQYCLIFDDVQIGVETRIGNFTMIRGHTIIGRNCVIGSYVDIEGEVQIGDFVSLQSGCYIPRGVIIESEVFCGPRVLTINDKRISYRRTALKFEPNAAANISGGSNRRWQCPRTVLIRRIY